MKKSPEGLFFMWLRSFSSTFMQFHVHAVHVACGFTQATWGLVGFLFWQNGENREAPIGGT